MIGRRVRRGGVLMLEKMDEFFDARLDIYDEHQLTEIESAREFYPLTAGLPKNWLCRTIAAAVKTYAPLLEDPIPQEIREKNK